MKLKAVLRKYLPNIIATLLGAVGGYLFYHFIGCATGACVIVSNPVISTLYGGAMGWLLGSALTPGACCALNRKDEKEETE